jgi:hypothetical protein
MLHVAVTTATKTKMNDISYMLHTTCCTWHLVAGGQDGLEENRKIEDRI